MMNKNGEDCLTQMAIIMHLEALEFKMPYYTSHYSNVNGTVGEEEFTRMFCEILLPQKQSKDIPTANNDVIPDGFYLVGDEN